MKKSILKKNYYYEEYPIYDTLPDNLEPLEYTEQVFTKYITHKEILETLKPTIHSVEDAFRIACTYINNGVKNDKIIYFDYNGTTCRLSVWLDDGGGVEVYVHEVDPDNEYSAGDGVLSRKILETKQETMTPSNSDTVKNIIQKMRDTPPPFNASPNNPMKHIYQNYGYMEALDKLLEEIEK